MWRRRCLTCLCSNRLAFANWEKQLIISKAHSYLKPMKCVFREALEASLLPTSALSILGMSSPLSPLPLFYFKDFKEILTDV